MENIKIQNILLAFLAYRAVKIISPSEIKSVEGKVCLVTGAGGGLGLSIIRELKKRKCGKLILWDIKQEALNVAGKEAMNNFETKVVDLSKKNEIYEAIKEVKYMPDFVFNVAGIVLGKYLSENSDQVDELTFQVNTMAPLYIMKAFLPLFEKRGSGHFINVASAAAFVGAAGMVTYSGSKAALMMMSQALTSELVQRNSPIKVTCVCPSHFETPLFSGFKYWGSVFLG